MDTSYDNSALNRWSIPERGKIFIHDLLISMTLEHDLQRGHESRRKSRFLHHPGNLMERWEQTEQDSHQALYRNACP